MKNTKSFIGLILILVLAFTGCSSIHESWHNLVKPYPLEYHLQRMAKDWCMTIRASQVIPVYPLTEDLQPGDIFLVEKKIKDEHNEYTHEGFLPLDNPLVRIKPSKYKEFYSNSFPVTNNNALPKYWININSDTNTTTTLWHKAPLAAFPTYSFSVRSGGGGNIAVPVEGVPVGLSLLGANTAEGTISISKTYTYGVDFQSLYEDVQKYMENNSKFEDLLLNLLKEEGTDKNSSGNMLIKNCSKDEEDEEDKKYLRVVSRVYLASEMDVSLYSTTKGAAAGSAGATKPVDLLLQETRDKKSSTPQTLDAYNKSVNSLNAMLETALAEKDSMGNLLPGGTLKVTSVSDRSVSMKETFARPLVIGYLGFDIPIDIKETEDTDTKVKTIKISLEKLIPTTSRIMHK